MQKRGFIGIFMGKKIGKGVNQGTSKQVVQRGKKILNTKAKYPSTSS